jgi:hypothetical protein
VVEFGERGYGQMDELIVIFKKGADDLGELSDKIKTFDGVDEGTRAILNYMCSAISIAILGFNQALLSYMSDKENDQN